MPLVKRILFLLALSVLFSCEAHSRLPNQRPQNFSIFFQQSNVGMRGLGRSAKLHIKAPQGEYIVEEYSHEGKNKTVKRFSVTSKDLDFLYKQFKKYRFNEISVQREEVRDRFDGPSIEIQLNDKRISKSNTGTDFIKGDSLVRFQAIIKQLHDFKNQKLLPRRP